jgi:hypothetical protein
MLDQEIDDRISSFGCADSDRRKIGPIAVLTKIGIGARFQQGSRNGLALESVLPGRCLCVFRGSALIVVIVYRRKQRSSFSR